MALLSWMFVGKIENNENLNHHGSKLIEFSILISGITFFIHNHLMKSCFMKKSMFSHFVGAGTGNSWPRKKFSPGAEMVQQ